MFNHVLLHIQVNHSCGLHRGCEGHQMVPGHVRLDRLLLVVLCIRNPACVPPDGDNRTSSGAISPLSLHCHILFVVICGNHCYRTWPGSSIMQIEPAPRGSFELRKVRRRVERETTGCGTGNGRGSLPAFITRSNKILRGN